MMREECSLHSFKIVLPRFSGPQSELVDWILKAHASSMELTNFTDRERLQHVLKRFAVNEKLIGTRYFDTDREGIYKLTKETPSGRDLEERHLVYQSNALRVLDECYTDRKIPDHLIHVTCTGYISPSAPQVHFSEKISRPAITHAYHMGCYAAIPAIRMARAFALSENQQVDVLHTEMCSLHLDPASHTPEQMVVQTLFADGHIKYNVGKAEGRRLVIHQIHEQLIPGSSEDMTWMPTANHMKMSLSKEVPEKIKGYLPEFLRKMNVPKEECLFAIHPGGPKIIDLLQKQLELSDEQILFSRKILFERGNMSSATLPHIWKEILDSDYKGKVASLAFGPGLTIFGSVSEAKS